MLVGGADYPTAVYGSGACRPGLASDVTGTSCILTLIADAPLLDAEICNVATIEGRWGPFVLLETGGDAVRVANICGGGKPWTMRARQDASSRRTHRLC